MKKTVKAAMALAVLGTPAFAANMENPLYAPKAGEVYSKTAVGVMYKIADDTDAQVAKNHDGKTEFPIWRAQEDLGYGITDRLSINGQFGYTYNDDIDRKGLHLGRLGLNYRIMADASELVWDVYADAHLGGVSEMTGMYRVNGFTYDNYSTGQYGMYAGTKVGKTWGDLTGALYAEVGYFFPGDNTSIDFDLPSSAFPPAPNLGAVKGNAVADMKSFMDWTVGTKWSYNIDQEWTAGFGLAWKRHGEHKVKSADVKISELPTPLTANKAAMEAGMEAKFKDMGLNDSFDEFPVTLSIANQVSETVQVAVYGEYTFDNGDDGSQNTTDTKVEFGARVNAQF